jgi:twitching motility two-component system response regulator PilH
MPATVGSLAAKQGCLAFSPFQEICVATDLITDDSVTEVHQLKSTLEGAGHSMLTERSGEEGVEVARQSLPDVILMDIAMPGLNGFQATRQLHKNDTTRDIPVIVVSTKAEETGRIWALRQGACEYLVKPVKGDVLLSAVKAAVA